MSVNDADEFDEDQPPETLFGPGAGRMQTDVILACVFPDGKIWKSEVFSLFADHCLNDAEIMGEVNFYLGPMWCTTAGYERIRQKYGDTLQVEIIGSTCSSGSE